MAGVFAGETSKNIEAWRLTHPVGQCQKNIRCISEIPYWMMTSTNGTLIAAGRAVEG